MSGRFKTEADEIGCAQPFGADDVNTILLSAPTLTVDSFENFHHIGLYTLDVILRWRTVGNRVYLPRRTVVVGILHVQRVPHAFLTPKYDPPGRRYQSYMCQIIAFVGVVQYPLNDPGRCVLVPTVRFPSWRGALHRLGIAL